MGDFETLVERTRSKGGETQKLEVYQLPRAALWKGKGRVTG